MQELSSQVGSFLRSKSLPGPVLIPGSAFQEASLPFKMPPPPQPTYTPYPEEPPATPPAPPSPAGDALPGGGDASGGGRALRFPQRPTNLREMLQSQAASGSPPRDVTHANQPGQSLLQSPERGDPGSWPASAPGQQQQDARSADDSAAAPELCKMTFLQRRNSPSAWLNSRSTSFKAEDNPFG